MKHSEALKHVLRTAYPSCFEDAEEAVARFVLKQIASKGLAELEDFFPENRVTPTEPDRSADIFGNPMEPYVSPTNADRIEAMNNAPLIRHAQDFIKERLDAEPVFKVGDKVTHLGHEWQVFQTGGGTVGIVRPYGNDFQQKIVSESDLIQPSFS